MSNSIAMIVPGSFTDPNLPISKPDPIVVNGSLLLSDCRDLVSMSNGAAVRNIASDFATPLVGADASAGLSLSMPTEMAATTERSGRAGLHVAVSQTVALGSGVGAALVLPQWLINYILANPTHIYYLSMWQRLTRVVGAGTNALGYAVIKPAGGAFDHLISINNNGVLGSNIAGYRVGNELGPQLLNEAAGNNGITNVGDTAGFRSAARWGRLSPLNSSAADQLRLPSYVWYRTYVEDLTVSGRSYASVNSADLARFNAEVLAEGGGFYADTFTPPAALAP